MIFIRIGMLLAIIIYSIIHQLPTIKLWLFFIGLYICGTYYFTNNSTLLQKLMTCFYSLGFPGATIKIEIEMDDTLKFLEKIQSDDSIRNITVSSVLLKALAVLFDSYKDKYSSEFTS